LPRRDQPNAQAIRAGVNGANGRVFDHECRLASGHKTKSAGRVTDPFYAAVENNSR